jgi:hypothetical protein
MEEMINDAVIGGLGLLIVVLIIALIIAVIKMIRHL